MEGAEITKVNPNDCAPFIVDRDEYRGSLDKMIQIFCGLMGGRTFIGGKNISAGVGALLQVPMTKCYRPHLTKMFRILGHEEDERLTSDKIWYVIVDGNFRL